MTDKTTTVDSCTAEVARREAAEDGIEKVNNVGVAWRRRAEAAEADRDRFKAIVGKLRLLAERVDAFYGNTEAAEWKDAHARLTQMAHQLVGDDLKKDS